MRIRPPLVFILSLLVAFVLHKTVPTVFIYEPYNAVGAAVVVAGFLLMCWTVWTFDKNKTSYKVDTLPSVLVTEGPMKFSRNPIYLGFVLMLVGVSIYVGSALMFAGPVVFFTAINNHQIPLEERTLEKKFGKKYIDYKKKVRRWL